MEFETIQRTLNKILGQQLAKQFLNLRETQKILPAQIALQSELTCFQIEQIEQGANISFDKYLRLAKFYGKKIKVGLE